MHKLLGVVIICCFALPSIPRTNGQLVQSPRNVAAMLGDRVTLLCKGTKLAWLEYITDTVNPQEISTGKSILDETRYGLNTEPAEKYDLIIKSVVLADGGTYQCGYRVDATQYTKAELIVFGSDIVCNNNITSSKAAEGDYIEYSCMVKYKGKWAPVMEWKKANAVLKAKDESTADTVKYTQVTMLTPEDNDQSFTCRPYFDQPKSGSTATGEADNIPTTKNVLTTHIFPKLTVYYGPRMLMVEPKKDFYSPGDEVKITADSNPSAMTYKWVNTETSATLGTEDTITITDEMLESQSPKVIVCNIVPIPKAKTNCKELQLNVTLKTSHSASVVVGGVLGVVLSVAIAIIVRC